MTSRKQRHRSERRSRGSKATVPFWKDPTGVSPAVFLLACGVFAGGLLLGGSGGSFGDSMVQLIALPLIVLAAMHWTQKPLQSPDWAALAIVAGIAALAFVQLMPLPGAVWAALPGRAELLRDLQSVGIAPAWQSLSLDPFATERALQWTLPAIAMFLAVRWMSARQRRILLLFLFFGALVLLVLTVTQNTASQGDALATANNAIAKATFALNATPIPTAARPAQFITGLFSNRNHFATFLAMTIPLVVAMGLHTWLERPKDKDQSLGWVSWVSLLVLVMLGLLAGMIQTHSRAALVLGGIALLGSLGLLRRLHLNRTLVWSVAGCAVVGALAAIQMAASVTLARLDTSPDTDARWQIHATTLEAARHFGPLGSGLGTFVQAYQQGAPEKDIGPFYINHAHSDYHELWLETGIPGALLIIGFIGWFGWSTWRVWGDTEHSAASTLIARAATLSILMVLLHSYLDYPLRKTAILVVFGMACALLTPTEAASTRHASQSHRKRVTLPSQSATIAD